jgi:hypothetical protein
MSQFYKLYSMILSHISIMLGYVVKTATLIKSAFYQPLSLSVSIPIITFSVLNKIQLALLLLAFCIFIDFVTGLWVSYEEKLKKFKEEQIKIKSRLRFLFIEVLESEKIRYTILKALVYGSFILVIYIGEKIFFIQLEKDIEAIDKVFYTLLVIGILCAVEMYSAIFENAKKLGLDLELKINNFFNWLVDIKQKIKS